MKKERTKQSFANVWQLLERKGLKVWKEEACGGVCNGSAAFFNVISCNCFACARAAPN